MSPGAMGSKDELIPGYPMVRWRRGKYDRAAARRRREFRRFRHRVVKPLLVTTLFTALLALGLLLQVVTAHA